MSIDTTTGIVAGQMWRERRTGRIISIIHADNLQASGARVRYKDMGTGHHNSLLVFGLLTRWEKVRETTEDTVGEKRAQQTEVSRSVPTLAGRRKSQYAALDADYRAKRAALDINYDQALDQHGADPVLLVAYMDGFDALDAEFLAKRDALDATGERAGV